MIKAILGKKIGMTRIFDKEGKVIPVTLVEAGPCVITQIKSKEIDGYQAVQIGFGQARFLNKPLSNHLKKAGIQARWLREVPTTGENDKVGDKITVANFQPGEKVSVVGISKGKGFAGTVKRHGFSTGPKTHGSNNYRQPGSIGCMFPQRVIKGKKMSGHLGAERVTVRKLSLVEIDQDQNLLLVKGALPGPNQGLMMIRGENL